jgi:hypothetical protein
VNPTGRLALLQEFFRETAVLHRRHQASAERVSAYDGNNAYQYVLAREDAHLAWIRRAIESAGGAPDEVPGAAAAGGSPEGDAATAIEFLSRWQARVSGLTHARDRKMLELVLGEVAEHQRFFAQAAGGSAELLGRRPDGAGTGGGVLPRRWVE